MNCTAEVLYPQMGQGTAPEVNFTFEGEIGKNPDEEDNTFYQRLMSMKEPLQAQNIPGTHIKHGKSVLQTWDVSLLPMLKIVWC